MSDLEAFCDDLRTLRERRGLSIDQLAAIAHFPPETLTAAETGPARPSLPVVEAYVRGCGADPGPWHDRWRDLPAGFTLVRLGATRRRSHGRALTTAAAAAVVLAAGGTAIAVLRPASHPSATGKHIDHITTSPHPSAPPSSTGSQAPRPARGHRPPGPTAPAWPEVTGYGCPDNPRSGVSLDSAAAGPGWNVAGGGWTGNGCNGSSIWTMNPSGLGPSAMTWRFTPGNTTACTLAVFIPAENALGLASYAIGSGPGPASLASLTVDQATVAGQWVRLGRFPVSGPTIQIQLSGPLAAIRGHNSAIAASAASARCS
jgi:Helix-turn-helix domain